MEAEETKALILRYFESLHKVNLEQDEEEEEEQKNDKITFDQVK